MLKRILVLLAFFIAISLVVLWIISGGFGAIIDRSQNLPNLLEGEYDLQNFRLPWQPDALSLGVPFATSATITQGVPPSEPDFGSPSPHWKKVRIESGNVLEEDVGIEYIALGANWDNTTPIDITGWSLHSAVSGVRAFIPRGTDVFLMGTINEQRNIQMDPGGSAVIASGPSPVGTSFRENMCTGYLNQVQSFSPELPERCPSSSEVIPVTAENLRYYGDACVDFARTIPKCSAPLDTFTSDLSLACRTHLANTLSYNGCVFIYRDRTSFNDNVWRVYFGASRELWRNTHDVIRLLDAEGKIVDSLTY